MKKIAFVCLGNICRSPMAEFVMKSLTDKYEVQSRATSSWEHGNSIHKGTQEIFRSHGVPYDTSKTSQQISMILSILTISLVWMSLTSLICVRCVHRINNTRYNRLHLKAFQTHGIQVILKKLTIGFQPVVELG